LPVYKVALNPVLAQFEWKTNGSSGPQIPLKKLPKKCCKPFPVSSSKVLLARRLERLASPWVPPRYKDSPKSLNVPGWDNTGFPACMVAVGREEVCSALPLVNSENSKFYVFGCEPRSK